MNIINKILLIAIWLMVAMVVVFTIKAPDQFFSNGTTIIGWILFAIQLTYNKSTVLQKKIKRMWLTFLNKENIWNIGVRWHTLYTNVEVLDNLDQTLFNEFANKTIKVQQLSKVRRNYRVGTIIFDVNIKQDEGKVIVDFFDLEVGYRRTNQLLDRDILQIIEKMKLLFKPDQEFYSARVTFGSKNPYIDFLFRKDSEDKVEKFQVKSNNGKSNIVINKNNIEINSRTYNDLKEADRKSVV